jgi:hypothetical protein
MSIELSSTITEQYLNKIYEDLQKEQMTLMNKLKAGGETEMKDAEQDITKQISQMNAIMVGCMRLRNLRKRVQQKG